MFLCRYPYVAASISSSPLNGLRGHDRRGGRHHGLVNGRMMRNKVPDETVKIYSQSYTLRGLDTDTSYEASMRIVISI